MIIENNLTPLSLNSRFGNPTENLCAVSESTASGSGQVSMFQQLMALIAGSGQDTISVQENAISETDDENTESPSELVGAMALNFFPLIEATPMGIPIILPEQLNGSNTQSCSESLSQIESTSIAGSSVNENSVVIQESINNTGKDSAGVVQDSDLGYIAATGISESSNGSDRIPIFIEDALKKSPVIVSENTLLSMEESGKSSPLITEESGKSTSLIAKESMTMNSPIAEKPGKSNALIAQKSEEPNPLIAEGPGEASSLIAKGSQKIPPVIAAESLESSPVIAKNSSEEETVFTEVTGENKTDKAEEWTGDVVSNQEIKGSMQADAIEKPEVYTQIKEEILDKLEQKGPSEFKLHLKPEELGEIDIKLKLSDGKLVIHIASVNPKTQTLLAGQVDKLLLNMGLPNAQVEILQGPFQSSAQEQSGSNPQNHTYSANAGMDFSQKEQRDPLQRQWQNNHSRMIAANVLQQEVGMAGSGLMPGQRNYSNRMDYVI